MMSGAPTTPGTMVEPFRLRTIMAPLVAIILGTFMAILDNTVVNVALPTLERVFKTDLHVMQWVITAYMLAQAAVIPLSGWLSDRFGAKTIYIVSLVLFTLGSMLCAIAQSGEMLIVFRILQGLGGGMLMPIGMSFIYRLAPPDKRGAVMGAFGIPILLAPALGPVLSGWLVQYADWRFIFLINVPVGMIAVLVALRALPALTAQRAAGSLDAIGVVLAPLGFAALSYGISESSSAGWTATSTLGSIAVGVVVLIAFSIRELTTEHPLLELRVFRSLDFSLAVVTQWVGQSALFGAIFLIPLFLQQVRGYGAFDTGLNLLPQAIAAGLFMPIGGRLFDRIGARPPVIAGLLLVSISTLFLAHITGSTTGAQLRFPLAMRGAGMGLMMMPLNTHMLNAAPRELVSRVTSLTSALQSVVSSLAVATLATILSNRIAVHQATALANSHHTPATVANAMASSFGDTFMVAAVTAGVGILLAFTLRRSPRDMTESAGSEPAKLAEGAFEAALG